jgi:hypothetical protein
MLSKSRLFAALVFSFTLCFMLGCSTIKEITQALSNLQRLKFKLENVSNFQFLGIDVSQKKNLSDFNAGDLLRFAQALSEKSFPASFTLNVGAVNPNDGTGGSPKTASTLTSLAWTLLIDNTLTINGDIQKAIEIPGTGQQTTIPLTMSLDLYSFFGKNDYQSLVNLALALGGASGSSSRVTLRAKPTVSTPFGPITYPGTIDIIDREFRSQ